MCFLALAGYICYTLYSTIFARNANTIYRYEVLPFWSYIEILDGKTKLIKENLLNVLLFVPIGFLLSFINTKRKMWKIALFGFGLSFCIELTQLIAKRGFCEFDDLFHNTLGCLLGYVLVKVFTRLCVIIRWRN